MEGAVWWRDGAAHQPAVLQWLVDHGADVNQPMRSGSRLIHFAASKGNRSLVGFLLKNGAKTSFRSPFSGLTAEEEAMAKGFDDVSELFSEKQVCGRGLGRVLRKRRSTVPE